MTCPSTIDEWVASGGSGPFHRGIYNFMIPLTFHTGGERWLVRFPNDVNCTSPQAKHLGRLYPMHSEYETVKVLQQIAPQYIPNAWLPAPAKDQLPHFFMEFIPSMSPDNPLAGQTRKFGWEPTLDTTIRDMAAFYMRLASVPFEGIGSFMSGHYTLRSDGIVAPPLSRYLRFGPWTDLKHAGPYMTSREMWLAAIDFRMLQIEGGAIGEWWEWQQAYLALSWTSATS